MIGTDGSSWFSPLQLAYGRPGIVVTFGQVPRFGGSHVLGKTQSWSLRVRVNGIDRLAKMTSHTGWLEQSFFVDS